jgi:hypothetical protein
MQRSWDALATLSDSLDVKWDDHERLRRGVTRS